MGERISYLHEGKFTPEPEPVQVGDVVKTGPNDYPRFKVIALDSGRAWLRNVISGEDAVISLEECCWRVQEGGDQRIGRLLKEPSSPKTGPQAPVEPTRIDRISTSNEPPSPFAERGA